MQRSGAPLVGITGVVVARFQAGGMARATFATALAQAVAMVIVLMVRDPQATPWSWAVVRGFAGNAVDLALFVASALLFRKAARSGG